MRIIEFCGTPGCGKTTLCDQLLDELKAKGFTANNYNELKGSISKGFFRYLFKKGFFGSFMRLMTVMGFPNRDRIIYGMKIAVVRCQIDEWSKNGKTDYLLFDEGILQYITSLSHGKPIANLEKLPKVLKPIYESADTYIIDSQVDIDTNIERLKKRANQGDRFLAGDTEEQKATLELKFKNIQAVLAHFAPSKLLQIDTANGDALKEITGFVLKDQ